MKLVNDNKIQYLTLFGSVAQYALPVGAGLWAISIGHWREGLGLGVSAAIQQIFFR